MPARPIYVETRMAANFAHAWSALFGYSGWFDAEFRAVKPGDVPPGVKPVREERRE